MVEALLVDGIEPSMSQVISEITEIGNDFYFISFVVNKTGALGSQYAEANNKSVDSAKGIKLFSYIAGWLKK